jgi:hypothetical protein
MAGPWPYLQKLLCCHVGRRLRQFFPLQSLTGTGS